MPTARLRCPACRVRFDTRPEEDDYPVVLCPECDEPIDRVTGTGHDRPPAAVWVAGLLAVLPPVLLLAGWLYASAVGGRPEPLAGLIAVATLVVGSAVAAGLWYGSKAARMALFTWGVICKVVGVVGFVVGIPLICVWGIGLVVMAASVPVIAYAFVLLMAVGRPSVRRWCERW